MAGRGRVLSEPYLRLLLLSEASRRTGARSSWLNAHPHEEKEPMSPAHVLSVLTESTVSISPRSLPFVLCVFFQIARQEGRVILTSGLPYQTVSVQSFGHFSGVVPLHDVG